MSREFVNHRVPKAERLRRERASMRWFTAEATDGEVLSFQTIWPPPAAIIWRHGKTTFFRFDDAYDAQLFMEKFGNDQYHLATSIMENDHA